MIEQRRWPSCVFAALLSVCAAGAAQSARADAPAFFHIEPVRPVSELLPVALAAKPPEESGEFRDADLVELVTLDPTIKLDIRYATTRNFLGTPLYSQARAFLQRPAAEALVRVQKALAADGYGLLVHDAYRPWYVTKIFWDATPADKHQFVADPATGSRHNRGCAVDLTLYTLRDGKPVEMPSLYDEMSERAYPNYAGGSDEQRRLRDFLRKHMEAEGFAVYEFEWWHFDYRDWKSYKVQNVRFEDIGRAPGDGAKASR
jgi:D-alanyl-D-alanine dipeptidase